MAFGNDRPSGVLLNENPQESTEVIEHAHRAEAATLQKPQWDVHQNVIPAELDAFHVCDKEIILQSNRRVGTSHRQAVHCQRELEKKHNHLITSTEIVI